MPPSPACGKTNAWTKAWPDWNTWSNAASWAWSPAPAAWANPRCSNASSTACCRQHCQALYCHLSHLPSAGLLKLVVTQLGESPRRGKERIYEQILERAARAEGTLLLVFDEAHLLDGDALTDLRLLISSALDVRPPLKLLLVGQEPLRAVLRRAQHADLLNRISVRYQLRPLTREQTCRYIDFQLTQAGGDAKLFDDSVKAAIHDFTGGVPRQINNLATACLLQATARKVRRIDDDLFQQVAGEFQLP